MLYTPLYYDKNNYKRKEGELLPLHHTASQPPITLPFQYSISTLQAVAHSSGGGGGDVVIVDPHCWPPSPCHHPYAPAFLPTSSCL